MSQIGVAAHSDQPEKYPTLTLLHGLSDDHTAWTRYTSIERYAAAAGIAVVMPAVNRSFYADMASGPRYWTFISEELPLLARYYFPLSDRREENFVAGLSMGGYGAFKLALHYPERYAAAASLSGALDVVNRAEAFESDFNLIFGGKEKIAGSSNDLFHLAEKLTQSNQPQPQLLQICGTEDFLYEDNVRFRDFARSQSLNHTYEEGPGAHSWDYWDTNIQRVLQWLPIRS